MRTKGYTAGRYSADEGDVHRFDTLVATDIGALNIEERRCDRVPVRNTQRSGGSGREAEHSAG